MGRKPCCDKEEVKKGPWTAEEDRRLMSFMFTHGQCRWRAVPQLAGLRRCGKSCRLRWTNYLRPDLKRGLLSEEEEKLIIYLHSKIGNRWSRIAAQLPGRTDNEIKNHWNTRIKKKLAKMGIDPNTHKSMAPIEEHKSVDEVQPSISTTNSSSVERDATQMVQSPQRAPSYDPTEVEMDELDDYISTFCTDDVPLIHPAGVDEITGASSSSASASATASSNGASSSLILEEEYSKTTTPPPPPPVAAWDSTSLDIDVSDYFTDMETKEILRIQTDDITAPCAVSADHDQLGFLDSYDMAFLENPTLVDLLSEDYS